MRIHGGAVPGVGNTENKEHSPFHKGPHLVEEGVEQTINHKSM